MSLLHKKWSFPDLFTFTKDIFNGKLHSYVQWLLFAEVCIHTCNLFLNKAPCCSIIKMKTIFAFILSLAFTYPYRWFDSFYSYVPFLYLLKRFQGYGNKTLKLKRVNCFINLKMHFETANFWGEEQLFLLQWKLEHFGKPHTFHEKSKIFCSFVLW